MVRRFFSVPAGHGEKRPAARRVTGLAPAVPPVGASPPWIHEGPQVVETVRRDAAGGGQLPERILESGGQQPGTRLEFGEELGPAAFQDPEHLAGRGGQVFGVSDSWPEPAADVAPEEQTDRRRPGRPRRAPAGSRLRHGRPAPDDLARETVFVQPVAAVAGDSDRQDLGFPGRRRRFESLELSDHVPDSARPVETGFRSQVLPRGEELEEGGGAHRRRLAAEPGKGEPVDAGQHPAVAPLGRAVTGG